MSHCKKKKYTIYKNINKFLNQYTQKEYDKGYCIFVVLKKLLWLSIVIIVMK